MPRLSSASMRRCFFLASILSISRRLVQPLASAHHHHTTAQANGQNTPHQGQAPTGPKSVSHISSRKTPSTTKTISRPHVKRLPDLWRRVNAGSVQCVSATVAHRKPHRMQKEAMKSLPIVILALAAAPVWANPQLAQQKNCMACHAVDN